MGKGTVEIQSETLCMYFTLPSTIVNEESMFFPQLRKEQALFFFFPQLRKEQAFFLYYGRGRCEIHAQGFKLYFNSSLSHLTERIKIVKPVTVGHKHNEILINS